MRMGTTKWQEGVFTAIVEAFLTSFNHPQVMVENQIAYSELCSRKFFLKALIENATTQDKLAHTFIPVFRKLRQEDCKFRDKRS